MGTNRANPAAMILSATMMLRHLGFVYGNSSKAFHINISTVKYRLAPLANNIASATFNVINDGKVRTADMGGEFSLPVIPTRLIDYRIHSRLRNYIAVHLGGHQKPLKILLVYNREASRNGNGNGRDCCYVYTICGYLDYITRVTLDCILSIPIGVVTMYRN